MTEKNDKVNDKDWKNVFNGFMNTAQLEIKKATQIGKKMIIAGQTNSRLHELYEELGKLAFTQITKGDLKWEHLRVSAICEEVNKIQSELSEMENEVQNIKKG